MNLKEWLETHTGQFWEEKSHQQADDGDGYYDDIIQSHYETFCEDKRPKTFNLVEKYEIAINDLEPFKKLLNERLPAWISLEATRMHIYKGWQDDPKPWSLHQNGNMSSCEQGQKTKYTFKFNEDNIVCEAITTYSGCGDEKDWFEIPASLITCDNIEIYMQNLKQEIALNNEICQNDFNLYKEKQAHKKEQIERQKIIDAYKALELEI